MIWRRIKVGFLHHAIDRNKTFKCIKIVNINGIILEKNKMKEIYLWPWGREEVFKTPKA